MFIDWLRWLHYTYVYAPKRMKIIQEKRKARKRFKSHRRYENQIREIWRTNPKKKPISDKFLLDESANRLMDKTLADAKEIWTREKKISTRQARENLRNSIRNHRFIGDYDKDVWDSRPTRPKRRYIR